MVRFPSLLVPGQKVTLIAPAFSFNPELYAAGRSYIENNLDLRTATLRDVNQKHLFFAGSYKTRLTELVLALTSNTTQGVIAIRGGYGCAPLYPELKKRLKSRRGLKPKVFMGFSDLTILLNGLYQDFGWITYHGPMVAGRPFRKPSALELSTMSDCLFRGFPQKPISTKKMKALVRGQAHGVVIGGCLSLLVSTLGTQYEINTKNKILFLEDVAEAPYRLHRMLVQLRHAGKLDHVRGIVFGTLAACEPHADEYKNVGALDAIKDALAGIKVPIILDFPAGHGPEQATIPIGMNAHLSAGTRCALQYIASGSKSRG
jgi:muramoyltetrapeptide carboxypeptidase